jgi:hypothetical protein
MTEPYVFRNKAGCYSWMPSDRDAICDGVCDILEAMQGCSDEEINVEVQKYLGELCEQSKRRVN